MRLSDFTVVFAATAAADGCWTRYMQSVKKGCAIPSAIWSAAIIVVGAISIIEYTRDSLYVIPAALGAFIGTYVSMVTTPKELK
jgi:hypothetical protein